jgi:integrase
MSLPSRASSDCATTRRGAASGRIEIEDEACPGLLFRVTPRNVKSFSVIYRVLGEGGTSPKGRLLAGKQDRIFNWVVDREIVADKPIHGLKRGDLQATEEAGRALTDEEIRYIWSATFGLGYPFGPLYRLLLLTGQRRTEWAAASRSEINMDKEWLEVPKARYKGDRDHVVPLTEKSLEIVKDLPAWPGNDYFLFSTRDGRIPISGFSMFVPYRVHDLRVTCETRLATLGYNQDVTDAVLGHANTSLALTLLMIGSLARQLL